MKSTVTIKAQRLVPESVCSSFTGRVAFSVSGMAPSRDLSWPESVKMEEFS